MIKPITGTWFEFEHHNTAEGKYWNDACADFTDEQWREKVSEIASLGMKYIVLMCTALVSDQKAEAFYKTDILPYAPIKATNPIQTLLSAADEYDIKVFMSCGFYNNWTQTLFNMTSPEVTETAFKAMKEFYDMYGHHKSFYGWYYPDETCIQGYFRDEFIEYVNKYSTYVHKIAPNTKTLIAPYGTQFATGDDKYVEQLKCLDVDIIAYQDEIGVRKATTDETKEFYKKLRVAHDKAGKAKIWADMEIFEFEDEVYKSALVSADVDRIIKQLESISPYVDEVLCYQYQGMMNRPGTKAFCGCEGSYKMYNDIKERVNNEISKAI